MKRVTSLDNGRIETFGLSEEQHSIAVDMVKEDKDKNGNYTIEEVDDYEMVNVWISDAHSEGEGEYAEFLRMALAKGADIFLFNDNLGGFSQTIGEVVVY